MAYFWRKRCKEIMMTSAKLDNYTNNQGNNSQLTLQTTGKPFFKNNGLSQVSSFGCGREVGRGGGGGKLACTFGLILHILFTSRLTNNN